MHTKNGVAPNLKPLFINMPNYICFLTQNYFIHFPRMKMKTAPQLSLTYNIRRWEKDQFHCSLFDTPMPHQDLTTNGQWLSMTLLPKQAEPESLAALTLNWPHTEASEWTLHCDERDRSVVPWRCLFPLYRPGRKAALLMVSKEVPSHRCQLQWQWFESDIKKTLYSFKDRLINVS